MQRRELRHRDASQEKAGRVRKISRAGANAFRRVASAAAYSTALLLGGLALTGRAHAEEGNDPSPSEPAGEESSGRVPILRDGNVSVRLMGGLYRTMEEPFMGLGVTTHLEFGRVTLDFMADLMSRSDDLIAPDHVELDLTFPMGPRMAMTVFSYISPGYYDEPNVCTGTTFHFDLPRSFGLHIAPQLCGPNMPVPVMITAEFMGGRLNTLVGVIPVINGFVTEQGPVLGGEFQVSVRIADRLSIFAKVFEMNILQDSQFRMGSFSFQGGISAEAVRPRSRQAQ